MQRILIIGCPGSGKSTMARRLAELTGLPVVHLDKLFWKPGWVEPTKEEWLVCLEKELARPAWIMDGNYNRTLDVRLRMADAVILFDLPRWVCLWRVVRRIFSSFGRIRPDMAPGCPERIDLEFLRYIWSYRRKKLPGDLKLVQSFPGGTFIVRTRRETKECLREFGVLWSTAEA